MHDSYVYAWIVLLARPGTDDNTQPYTGCHAHSKHCTVTPVRARASACSLVHYLQLHAPLLTASMFQETHSRIMGTLT